MSSTELAVRDGVNVAELRQTAQLLAASGYFEAKGSAEQAVAQLATKILAGREMGFGPFASVNGIHIIQGKPTVSANLMAAAVKASGRYDYRVRQMDDSAVSIEFFAIVGGKRESLGVSTFTMDDAKKAGTQNLQKFARNMLFARAMSNGVRWYCPDVFMAGGVYTPEEMGAMVEDGEYVEFTRRTVDTSTGEITEAPAAPDLTHTPAFKKMHALGREAMGDNWRNGEGREFLKAITGKESTKDLDAQEIANVIDALETLKRGAPPEPRDVLFDGPQTKQQMGIN